MADSDDSSDVDKEVVDEKLPPSGGEVELASFLSSEVLISPFEHLTAADADTDDPNNSDRGSAYELPVTAVRGEHSLSFADSEPQLPASGIVRSKQPISHSASLTSAHAVSSDPSPSQSRLTLQVGHTSMTSSEPFLQGRPPEDLLTPEEEETTGEVITNNPAPKILAPSQISIKRIGSDSSSFAVSSPIATPTGSIARQELQASADELSYKGDYCGVPQLSVSPYVMVKRGMADMSKFESPGLLYARAAQEKHNLDMLRPPDEVAEDVLEMWQDKLDHSLEGRIEEDMMLGGRRRGEKESWREPFSTQSREEEKDLELDDSASLLETHFVRELTPIDPDILRNLEKEARKVAGSLTYIMDNLRNSLYAMTVCGKASVTLHREAVDNTHSLVDSNIKATYGFLAKFEELQRHTDPLYDLAQQIKDINETLKRLEKNFRAS